MWRSALASRGLHGNGPCLLTPAAEKLPDRTSSARQLRGHRQPGTEGRSGPGGGAPRGVITLWCLQWEIYDAYVEELHKQERNKEKQKASKKEHEKSKKKTLLLETQVQRAPSGARTSLARHVFTTSCFSFRTMTSPRWEEWPRSWNAWSLRICLTASQKVC